MRHSLRIKLEYFAWVSAPLAILVLALAVSVASAPARCKIAGSQATAKPSTSNGHSITVKLLNADTGKPVKSIWVPLWELDEKYKHTKLLNAKTDSDGIAYFHFPSPLPERIEFSFGPDEFASCSEVQFATDQIIKAGIVAHNTCGGSGPKPSVSAVSGEIVIFGRRITLGQRMRREIP